MDRMFDHYPNCRLNGFWSTPRTRERNDPSSWSVRGHNRTVSTLRHSLCGSVRAPQGYPPFERRFAALTCATPLPLGWRLSERRRCIATHEFCVEIAGCFAFWTWLRRGASPFVAVLGVGSLVVFAVALTRVDSVFGTVATRYRLCYPSRALWSTWRGATHSRNLMARDFRRPW